MDAEFNAWILREGHETYLFKGRHDVDLFFTCEDGAVVGSGLSA